MADTTDDPPSVHLKLHWAGGNHTELTVRKNRTGYHNHINSEEVTELIRELALVCEDGAIVSILNRLGYRTGTGNTWTEKRVQHVRHTKGFPACPPPDQRRWITMRQAASMLGVSEAVVRRLIAQKTLPAKQIVKFAPWMRKAVERASSRCTTLKKKRVSPHVVRHGTAMALLQSGVDIAVIALWLGHESIETTNVYVHANLAMKEKALAKVAPIGRRFRRFRANDHLLAFLESL